MSPENPDKKFLLLENPTEQVQLLKIVLGAVAVLCVAGLASYYFACSKYLIAHKNSHHLKKINYLFIV